MHKNKSGRLKILASGWIGKAIGAFVSGTYLIALYYVLRTNLVPDAYVLPIVLLTGLLVIGVVLANVRNAWQSVIRSFVLVAISFVIVLANVYIAIASAGTYNFLSSIQSGEYTDVSYSIIAKKGVTTSNTIDYVSDDSNNTVVLTAVKHMTKAAPQAVTNLASITLALDNHSIKTAVIRTSYLSLLQDNDPNFYNSIQVQSTFNIRVKNSVVTKPIDITKPFVVYISGIDTYGNVDTVSRSDTNILAIVNPKTHKILLVNTPRDYYVQLHGTTGIRDKLTHSGIYGIDMSKDTMQDLYGININYYIRINFTSFLNIIDAIGGVNVYSDNDLTVGKYHFVKGYNQLDAKEALVFSRERHSFVDGDRTRGKDQQRVIQAIIDKMSQPIMLARYPFIINSVKGSFQTNASRSIITSFINHQANSLRSWQTDSISVTGSDSYNATYSMGPTQLYVMLPNIDSVNAAKAQIQSYLKP